jgi:hypothetical protein
LLGGGCIESAYRRASPRSHDDGPQEVSACPPGDDLGGPRRAVGADRADPQGVLAPQGLRAAAGELEAGPQRDHLPDAQRLPVGPTARAVRPQEHRPRLVPEMGRGGHLRGDLGGARRRVRRAGRGAVGVAVGRRDAGQGPVRGGKRRAGTRPTAARRGPRRAWWPTATAALWAS